MSREDKLKLAILILLGVFALTVGWLEFQFAGYMLRREAGVSQP